MMKKRLPLLLACFTVTGCALWPWEPLPSWDVEKITTNQVPKRVMAAMRAAHPNASIQKTERSTFGSRIQGHPKQYRFTFLSPSNTMETVVLDQKGEPVESDMWFHAADVQK